MNATSARRTRTRAVVLAVTTALLVPVTGQLASPSTAAPSLRAATGSTDRSQRLVTLADPVAGLADLDTRGSVLPTQAQQRAVSGLGAVTLRWNRFGTPASILPADGSLGAATSSGAVTSARAWLRGHATLLGLSSGQVDGLQLVADQRLVQSDAHAVLFRQRFGGSASDLATPALDSMVTVGVANGRIAYVSSSLTRTTGTPAPATLTASAAWAKAAADVGRPLGADDLTQVTGRTAAGWTRLTVPGFADEQLVRQRSLALADGSVRPVWEANVVDTTGGSAFAYTVMVDARTGTVLHRQNRVDSSSDAFPFQGEVTATDCGPKHPFELTDGNTRQIVATAAMANTADDIVVKIFDPQGQLLAAGDTGTSPEAATYTADSIPQGVYSLQVCPYADPTVPFLPPGSYAAMVATSDQGAPSAQDAAFPPRWRYFPANPTLDFSATTTPHNSVIGCWTAGAGCSSPNGPFRNVAAPAPWDVLLATGALPTLTTVGNNASTHEAWASPLTPGGAAQAPISPTREYTAPFTDAWNNQRCDPANLTPGGNDIDPVVGNLFVSHNRMHDYAYYLGFTERHYNLQADDYGRGGTGGDPEIGNAQAGALTGGQPSELGRDNANQITLQDGVPGITNQYLFQPIAGAFYSPCVDGALDMTVVGHEYTHAISNRMIGGPDESITSQQGGSMGESWGDLTGAEYLFSHGLSTGTDPWVTGAYATGNRRVGIRDYAINRNPLNFSDIGFDSPGVEVHADGEIWNGTQWQVRQALVRKYDARYPYADRRLQLACSRATANHTPLPARKCPGNRRWIQLMFDAFLLQQGGTSMLDARDAMLAADRMRFNGRDLAVMWRAFAQRGMGAGASVRNADDGQPTPGFSSPLERNVKVTFRASRGGGRFYVGRYSARVTPVADLRGGTRLDDTARFVAGRYPMVYVSPTGSAQRFTLRVSPTRQGRSTVVRLAVRPNLASLHAGARLLGSSAGSLNPSYLLDGTEDTNWGGVARTGNVDDTHPWVAVDLAGRRHTISRVEVSAMLNPAPASGSDVPLAADPDSGSRFTALRRFAIEVCTTRCGSSGATWKRVFVSQPDAFPATRPRPVAPDLLMRSFRFAPVTASAVRLVALENQCTGYSGYAGEQDADPLNDTDCATASDRGTIVHAAELQVS